MSQSDFEITFNFVGTNKNVKGYCLRLNSPMIIQALLDKAPFTVRSRGNIGMPKAFWMIFVEIEKGAEKTEYKGAKKGDIVYCPRQDALFLIYDETPKITLPVYYIGEITEGIENFADLRNGTMVRISFASTE